MPNTAHAALPTCPGRELVQLAEMAGINCIHLASVSEQDAVEALTGLILYHHLDGRARAAVHEHRRTLPSPFRAALDREQKRFDSESIRWGNGSGNTQTARGRSVNFDALGIRPNTIDVYGVDLNYVAVDGAFVVFLDDEKLWYYTQNARQGRMNFYVAGATQRAAQFFGAYTLSRPVTKTAGLSRIADVINRRTGKDGGRVVAGAGLFFAQEAIPLWGDIVGTPVPASGTARVLVWISEDKETWDRRVRFDIDPNGTVTYRVFGQ
ncbi:MAG: hypothetical protein JJU06_21400 [Ectothiorhodospiraceae bacterium]|nr:hypothetical protein [Ectothiorhodospiraceae bacterium]MCH8504346.1 hypothetical protein [Ectothiorhodospiraceae bacterium]